LPPHLTEIVAVAVTSVVFAGSRVPKFRVALAVENLQLLLESTVAETEIVATSIASLTPEAKSKAIIKITALIKKGGIIAPPFSFTQLRVDAYGYCVGICAC